MITETPYVYAESELGKGYIRFDESAPGQRYRHAKYLPYVILADGTREDLRETRNLYHLDGAIDQLRDRLGMSQA